MSEIRIGVDTGGTFTDFVFLNKNRIKTLKLPSTPDNPAESILNGIKEHLARRLLLVHGTTVSTNAFLQKKLSRCAFVTTKGFEHMLSIGRQNRIRVFNLKVEKPWGLIPLINCYGLNERTLKSGKVNREPSDPEIDKLISKLKKENIESVAVCFLHAYKNAANEAKVAGKLTAAGFYVTSSEEIHPEYREYERAVVTVINSMLKPVVSKYLNKLKTSIMDNPLYIIQSNGGILTPERIVAEPVRTIVSGPAGGVLAAKMMAFQKKCPDVITLDMGGTSTDVSVIKDYKVTLTKDEYIENLPLRIPVLDIATVGAGGGSIARIDRGGVLQVGPESAGAVPGPAGYGHSDLATVTDAFVVTGALIPELFLGGKMKIFPERSYKAVAKIARGIKKDVYETAEGIVLVSVSSMERALRSVTLEKGEDPRFYTLMPFGGAGGMVACMLAERLGIKDIIIPPFGGVYSAFGMLTADYKKEFARPVHQRYSGKIISQLEKMFQSLRDQGLKVLHEDGFSLENSEIELYLEVRYIGQSYELLIPYSSEFTTDFHRLHQKLYSYSLTDSDCEVVNLRVIAIGKTAKIRFEKKPVTRQKPTVYGQKDIYSNGRFSSFSIYLRDQLKPGNVLKTPCIVTSDSSTSLISDSFSARMDEFRNLELKIK